MGLAIGLADERIPGKIRREPTNKINLVIEKMLPGIIKWLFVLLMCSYPTAKVLTDFSQKNNSVNLHLCRMAPCRRTPNKNKNDMTQTKQNCFFFFLL